MNVVIILNLFPDLLIPRANHWIAIVATGRWWVERQVGGARMFLLGIKNTRENSPLSLRSVAHFTLMF